MGRKRFVESKYFFTIVCMGFIVFMTGVLFLLPYGNDEKKMKELWGQGNEAAAQGDYENALQKLEEAVSYIGSTIEEQDFELVEDLAQVQTTANLLNEAVETYTGLIQAGKMTADLYMKRGDLYDQLGEYSLMLKDYRNAVEADPYNKEVYEKIAQQLEARGHLTEAEVFRNTAVQFLDGMIMKE